MGPEKPPRTWAIGGRTRRVLIAAGVCVLLAVGGTVAAVRLSAPSPAAQALARLVTEVTTVPLDETVPSPSSTVIMIDPASGVPISGVPASGVPVSIPVTGSPFGNPDTQPPPDSSTSATIQLVDPYTSPAATGPRLTADGKPEVLYVDDGYCPYCLAQNWALIIALSRFGRFSGLSTARSREFDAIPPVDGWSFYGSSYVSRYLAFVPVEAYSSVLVNPKANPAMATSYRALQRLTPAEQSVFSEVDPRRSTPFLDVGGKEVLIGSGVVPSALAGLTWSQIAAGLRSSQSQVGMMIDNAAATLTVELCQLTGNRPAAACPH